MDDPLSQYGLKVSVVVAGFAGGLLQALSRKSYSFRDTIATPVCGALAAGYLTGPFVHYLTIINFPLPPNDGSNVTIHAGAFLVGVCGMRISDTAFGVISRLLKLKG